MVHILYTMKVGPMFMYIVYRPVKLTLLTVSATMQQTLAHSVNQLFSLYLCIITAIIIMMGKDQMDCLCRQLVLECPSFEGSHSV